MTIPRTPRELIVDSVNGALTLLRIAQALDEQHPGALHGLEESKLSEAYYILENAISPFYRPKDASSEA